jgi:hypothetical protein
VFLAKRSTLDENNRYLIATNKAPEKLETTPHIKEYKKPGHTFNSNIKNLNNGQNLEKTILPIM